jgi:alpha-tubulin suppressor-like RCC1 family protein
MTWTFQPQTVGQLHGVVVSDTHACALDASGNAFCWGWGKEGELGAGAFNGSSAPVMVLGGHTFVGLAVGQSHSCGIGTDGHVYCWGDNSLGQLGQPSAGWASSTPVQVVQP